MANGRALPTTLLFDELLGRAWNIALSNYGAAAGLADIGLPNELSKARGDYKLPIFKSQFDTAGALAEVGQHDAALSAQLSRVADDWAVEFQGVMQAVAPIGPGFNVAVGWLRRVTGGGDGLGYLGQDHRAAQFARHASAARASAAARGLPTPAGAEAALDRVTAGITGLFAGRLTGQMASDREAERRKLRIDAVETLVRLRNEALDAAMDYVFGQMNMMFDVFGRSNDYLTTLRRKEQAALARLQVRSAELQRWDARVGGQQDDQAETIRQAGALNERTLQRVTLSVEERIKRLRRFSSRTASILNSVGVSVNSAASESNTVDAEE